MISGEEFNKRFAKKARGRRHDRTAGKMNKLEAAYSQELLPGTWMFEAMKFRLADNTYYTPDFMVMNPEGYIEVHEVKGFWEDDARVKIKVFAEKFSWFVVKAVTRVKGVWTVESFD